VLQPPSATGDQCPSPNTESEFCNIDQCAPPPPVVAQPTPAPVVRPVLTLEGGDLITLQANLSDALDSFFVDPGVYCEDLTVSGQGPAGGLLVQDLWAQSHGEFPDRARVGVYRVAYGCQTAAGAHAEPLTRTVVVADTLCPVCVMREVGRVSQVEASFPYVDPGIDCQDSMGHVNVSVDNLVNVEAVGTYTVTYRARDASGNWNDGAACTNPGGPSSYVRTVTVIDTLKPVVHLRYKGELVHDGGDATGQGDGGVTVSSLFGATPDDAGATQTGASRRRLLMVAEPAAGKGRTAAFRGQFGAASGYATQLGALAVLGLVAMAAALASRRRSSSTAATATAASASVPL
jgi:hypothetical protein